MKKLLPKLTGSEIITYKGKLIEVVEQKMKVGNKEFTIEFARRSPGTRLIILSPDNKILLTNEYRTDIMDWDTKLPGGKVVDSLDEYNKLIEKNKALLEMAEEGARKEALEETGLVVDQMKHFATSRCGVTIVWDLYYFIVTKYHKHPDGQKLELGENIKLKWVSFKEAKAMCLNGKIQEDRSAAILLRFLSQSS